MAMANTAEMPGRIVIGLAGCSGSGKTTLAAELARTLNGVHFPIDHYYRDLSEMPEVERRVQNFDDPALIDSKLLAEHVAALACGESIERPVYDFSKYTRVQGQTDMISPSPYIIVEGLFALVFPELLPLYQLRIYIETPDDVCFERRLRRDMEERGRTCESIKRQYELTVRPSSLRFVLPSSVQADLILDGLGPLDWKMELVMSVLRKRGLLRLTT